MHTWKEKLPGWEFRLWDASCLEEIKEPWVHEAYKAKVYAHASDYIRLYAVYNYGGFYLDCDVEIVKDFSPLLSLPYVIGLENSNWGGYIEAATFGAEPGNAYIKKCMDAYHDRHFLMKDGKLDFAFIIPKIMQQQVEQYTVLNSVEDYDPASTQLQIFAPQFFSPKNYNTLKFDKMTSETFSIHHFKGSWRPLKMRINRFLWRHLNHQTAKFIQKAYQAAKKLVTRKK